MVHDNTGVPVIVTDNGLGPYQQTVRIGTHAFIADEPSSLGGQDAGPAPFELLLAGLGACTSITLRMYADRKQLPLTGVSVLLTQDKVADEERGTMDRIVRTITLNGDLTAEQRRMLLTIANKCPLHRALQSGLRIDSALADEDTGKIPS